MPNVLVELPWVPSTAVPLGATPPLSNIPLVSAEMGTNGHPTTHIVFSGEAVNTAAAAILGTHACISDTAPVNPLDGTANCGKKPNKGKGVPVLLMKLCSRWVAYACMCVALLCLSSAAAAVHVGMHAPAFATAARGTAVACGPTAMMAARSSRSRRCGC